jgi:predicted ATPase/class 3 adenylate cyclase
MVFTDLVGSTAMKALLPGEDIHAKNQQYFDTILTPHRLRVETNLDAFGGRVVKTEGDAYFLVFESAARAAQFLARMQQSHHDDPIAAPNGPLQVTCGLHSGSPLRDGNDFIGQEVDYAARIAALSSPGQIVVSETAAAIIRDSQIEGLALYLHGERDLKGIGRAPVYELLYGGRDPQPLKVASLAPHNLPSPSTPFIGRETEVAGWLELLREPQTRVLTLTGFGGLGKTRAALKIAELCAHEYAQEFPNGVWWIELDEARSAEAMIQRIASDLNFYVQAPPSAREQVLNYLHGQKVLLVLDNTEQIEGAEAVVRSLLEASPHLKCLITTRRALQIQAERRAEVRPLQPSEAHELFVERAQARKDDFVITPENVADIAELCQRLEGIPLAIELAAARIAVLAPRQIIERLDKRFQLLQTRAPDLPPRQRALRGAIDWSYELLPEEDRGLFAKLAVFAHGFTLNDAEAVTDDFDALEGVMELRRHSLLRDETVAATQKTRYLMLEAVRDYATEKLEELGEEGRQVRERHAWYFEGLAAAHIEKLRTPDEGLALRELESAFENLRAAADWARSEGRHELCARLCLVLGMYLQKRGFTSEAVRRIEIGLEVVGEVGAGQLMAQLFNERAGLHLDEREPTAARELAEGALALFQSVQDGRGQAQAHNLLGLAALDEAEWQAARAELEIARQLFGQADDQPGVAAALTNLGVAEYSDPAGNREQAAARWKETLQLRHQLGDARGIAEASNNLGALALDNGDLESAQRLQSDALEQEQALRHIFGVARSLYNLGEVALLRGDVTRSARLSAAAACLFGKVESTHQSAAREQIEAACAHLEYSGPTADAMPAEMSLWSLDELIAWANGAN